MLRQGGPLISWLNGQAVRETLLDGKARWVRRIVSPQAVVWAKNAKGYTACKEEIGLCSCADPHVMKAGIQFYKAPELLQDTNVVQMCLAVFACHV